jgi:hypothetical protein
VGGFVVARPWVFVVDGADKRASHCHFLPALTKHKTFLGTIVETVGEVVGVGGWRVRGLASEVILGAVAETGSTVGKRALEFVELITSW